MNERRVLKRWFWVWEGGSGPLKVGQVGQGDDVEGGDEGRVVKFGDFWR